MNTWQLNTNSVPQQIKLFGNLSLVLLLHLLLIWSFNNQRKSVKTEADEREHLQLFTVNLNKTQSAQAEKPDSSTTSARQHFRPRVSEPGQPAAEVQRPQAAQLSTATSASNTAELPGPVADIEESPAVIHPDKLEQSDLRGELRKIYRQTRQEFELRDKVLPAAKLSDLDVLAKKIAASAQTNRVGVYYENFVLPNGRPVTKVNTPYGSYCILLDKPGENPDLRLPKVPVTCGKF